MYTDSLHTTVFGGRCHLTAARFHFEYPEYADHEQILPVLLGRSSDGAVIRLLSCHACSFHNSVQGYS